MNSKKYVLYVEDEEVQAKLFEKIIGDEIKPYGYKIVVVNNGKDAAEFLFGKGGKVKVSRGDVGLILLDLSMYDISGFQLIEDITKSDLAIPVAVLTSHEDHKIEKEAKKLGASDYFIKGKDLAELERLKKFIIKNIPKQPFDTDL